MKTRSFFSAFAACVALSWPGLVPAQETSRLPVVNLQAGMHVIKAQVASTDEERQRGLMAREKLGANEGMVFLFHAPATVCMWMKDTPLPLSVAFLDQDGKIVNIEEMQANSLESHCGKKPVTYALEMSQGWFKKKNIKPGQTIQGLPAN